MKEILKKYNIKPNKRLGQNFLTDKSVLRKIINAADLKSDDTVLEIGPGLGILTKELAKRVKKVIAIEKDKRLADLLTGVEVINQDALKYTVSIMDYKLIANLPYYIASPIIRKFLEIKNKPELMVLMVQKEVAKRIVDKKGSILSISVKFYADVEIISYVSKKSFYPKPKVDSAIIKIVPKEIPDIDVKEFFNLVKKGFSSKRKMLRNNLNIDSDKRAEELSVQDWINLYEKR